MTSEVTAATNRPGYERAMSTFGRAVQRWRAERRMSQAALARAAEVSTRHLSFVETGRSRPSRQLVLVLCSALEIPLGERNELLLHAGFAPAYPTAGLDDPAMGPVREAIEFLLARSAPNGVGVYDHRWNLLRSNRPFDLVLRWLYAPDPVPAQFNAVRSLVDAAELGRWLVNGPELAPLFAERLRREALAGDPVVSALAAELRRFAAPLPPGPAPALVPVVIHRDGVTLRLFSTISVLGTALDVVLDGLRIETYFPADDATAAFVAGLAGDAGPRGP